MHDGVSAPVLAARAPVPAPLPRDATVFDRLSRLACALLDAPAALVVEFDAARTVVLGSHGRDGEAIASAALGNGRVGETALHPVATVPLADPRGGEVLGSLVVLDEGTREWTADQRAALDDLAAGAASELHWRRCDRDQRASEAERDALLERERAARGQAESAEKRYAFLAEVSALLDASLDYEGTFQKLARLFVPELADYCLIDETEANGGARRIARVHRDPVKEKILFAEAHHHADDDQERHPVVKVIHGGASVLVPEVTPDLFDALAHDADHRWRFEALGLRSFIVAPLVARGRVLGAITLGLTDSGRSYGAADLAHAEEVARRAAIAIDNARLYSQAQRAIRARDGVLSVVSHDLRNPLASIMLNATMVLDMAEPGANEAWALQNVRQVVEAVEQTNRLIEDLLDVARIEQAGLSLDRTAVDLRTLVESAVRVLAPVASTRGVSLAAEVAGPPLPVHADADRVVQVLSNLIGNAIKFTAEGGSVRVVAEAGGAGARVRVADTGTGISPDHLPHVFDRFWQVGRADRRGVGLGLPISRGIVEAHGGRIWIESEPGRGTTVSFTLPAAFSAPSRVEDDAGARPRA
ncbi:MAG TPA: GAF domain-containing sensor histidine kinase [Longimicrobium sp.]|nr:GAF domain-containing sensor histidine kinase [Longimicrobium sp.]